MQAEIAEVLQPLFDRQTVSATAMEAAIGCLMDGRASAVEISSLLTALRMVPETVEQLTGAARAMRSRATPIRCRTEGLLDTCGTGGDGLQTFNISTAAALVAAAAGAPVAKHGNRKATSSTGSADVLEALGVNLSLNADQVGQVIDAVRIGFCFAPLLHGAMKHAAPVRRELGFRTIFNLLGPLTNPAGAAYQLVGASRTETARLLAHTLAHFPAVSGLVVCGNNELDEVSLWGTTSVFQVRDGKVHQLSWTAADFGLSTCRPEDLHVDNAGESAAVIREVFAGREGPAWEIIVANAAAALLAARKVSTILEGAHRAKTTLSSGAAGQLLERLVQATDMIFRGERLDGLRDAVPLL